MKKMIFFTICMMILLNAMVFGSDNQETQLSLPEGEEVLEARTEYSKTYYNNAGVNTIYVSVLPKHYKDVQGRWQNIDLTLENSTDEVDDDGKSFAYKVTKNTHQTFLPRRSNGWVQLRADKSRLAFKLVAKNARALDKRDKGLKASEVFENCDLNYTVLKKAFKEEIVLKKPTSQISFEYLIRMHNLNITKTDEGELHFSDNEGKPVFLAPKPVMYDANYVLSEAIDTQLVKHGNNYSFRITPSQTWLTSPERKYPIVIDPTIINVQGDASYNRGFNYHIYLYIPCVQPLSSLTPIHKDMTGRGGDIYINSPLNVRNTQYGIDATKPYDIKVWFETKIGNPSNPGGQWDNDGLKPGTAWTDYNPPYFRITEWSPTSGTLGNILVNKIFYYGNGVYPQTYSGDCTIKGTYSPGKGAALIDMFSGRWGWHTLFVNHDS